jgi:hypothetical protein
MRLLKYLEPLWLGTTGKISIRRLLALVFSVNFILNTSYVIRHWEIGKSYADGAMLLGVEAALIAALLSLTTYSNMIKTKIDNGGLNSNTKEESTATTPFD